MSAQVDFYVLARAETGDKYRYACRIANKAFGQGMTVFIQTEDAAQSAAMDKLLWTFSQGSFVPHIVCGADGDQAPDAARYPVQIGAVGAAHACRDLLISLTVDAPADYAKFNRVAELIINQDDDKASGRRRFRFYREHGIEPRTHNIAAA